MLVLKKDNYLQPKTNIKIANYLREIGTQKMKYNCPIYRRLQPWVYWTFPRLFRQRYFAKYLCLVSYSVALWLYLVALWCIWLPFGLQAIKLFLERKSSDVAPCSSLLHRAPLCWQVGWLCTHWILCTFRPQNMSM